MIPERDRCPRCNDETCDIPAAQAAAADVPGFGEPRTPEDDEKLIRLGKADRECSRRPAVDWRAKYLAMPTVAEPELVADAIGWYAGAAGTHCVAYNVHGGNVDHVEVRDTLYFRIHAKADLFGLLGLALTDCDNSNLAASAAHPAGPPPPSPWLRALRRRPT